MRGWRRAGQWLQALRHGGRAFYAHGLRQSKARCSRRLLGAPDTEDYVVHRVHDRRQADSRQRRCAALGDACRRCRPPLLLRRRGGSERRAHLYHASVEPEADDEHLKIAYFFRKSTRGAPSALPGDDLAGSSSRSAQTIASSTGASPVRLARRPAASSSGLHEDAASFDNLGNNFGAAAGGGETSHKVKETARASRVAYIVMKN